jgi:hypothetical protein
MANVKFEIDTKLPFERVMAMLTNFSTRRPEIWPMLAPELYQVYRVEPDSAEVQEGSVFPARIWERDHYEWSADRVRWTVRESNYCAPGSCVEVRVRPKPGGGSHLRVQWNRRGVGLKGKLLIALVVLTRGTTIRRKAFRSAFDRALCTRPN